MSEADDILADDVLGGNWGRGAARALEWVVAVVAPLVAELPMGVDGERRLGECWRELGGEWMPSVVSSGGGGGGGGAGARSTAVLDDDDDRGGGEVAVVLAVVEVVVVVVGEGVLFPLRKKLLNPGTTMMISGCDITRAVVMEG